MGSPDASELTAAVLVDGRTPYAMFTASELTAAGARLHGPLLLEIGEVVELRLARGAVSADVSGTVREVVRGREPAVIVAFAAGAAGKLAPLLPR